MGFGGGVGVGVGAGVGVGVGAAVGVGVGAAVGVGIGVAMGAVVGVGVASLVGVGVGLAQDPATSNNATNRVMAIPLSIRLIPTPPICIYKGCVPLMVEIPGHILTPIDSLVKPLVPPVPGPLLPQAEPPGP